MDFTEVDPATLEKVLAAPVRAARASNKVDISIRNVTTWFKLPHTRKVCENPDCIDERPLDEADQKTGIRTAMCTEIAGKSICRICFLAGYGKT